jgi:hypothetical protein
LQEAVDGGLIVVDRGAFVVGERDADQHALQAFLRLE